MPLVAVPPAVSTPRAVATPMFTGLALFEESKPPSARFNVSVPVAKVSATVALVPIFSEPEVVFAAMAKLAVLALITVGVFAALASTAP